MDLRPVRSSPAFRRLLTGQSIAFVASRMVSVAIAYQVYDLTGSALAVGLLALTQFVPLVTLTLLGGAAADVFDRRRILVFSSLGQALAFAGLAVNATLASPSVAACFVLSFGAWSASSFGAGAMRSATPRLVPPDQLAPAVALIHLYSNFAAIGGPALAGILIGFTGLTEVYALAAAGAAAAVWSAVTLPTLVPYSEAGRVTLRSIGEGFRYLATQHVILAFFLIDAAAMIFGMPNALFPAIAEGLGDPEVVGYLFAAPAVGALAASLSSGWISRVGRQGVAIVIAVCAWGGAITLFGFTTALWPALALLAVAGAADQVSAIFRGTIVLTLTPDHMRGRLGGIEFAQVASTPALGNVEAGLVASLVSVRFAVVSGGVACIAATLLLAAAFPALLRYDAHRGPPPGD